MPQIVRKQSRNALNDRKGAMRVNTLEQALENFLS
jgi:hypothetical protein